MRRFAAIGILALQLGAGHAADPVPPAPAAREAPPAPISEEAIRRAVKEVLAEEGAPPEPLPDNIATLRRERDERLAAAFVQARVPDCLHPDALALQPGKVGPVQFSGLFLAPFVIAAKVRGKCR